MKIDSIVFDLDGTLWDTTAACAKAWNAVLQREGITYREISAHDVRVVTGRPHDDCIRITFADLESDQIDSLIVGTRTEDNIFIADLGGNLYPDVGAGLRRLSSQFRLFIVSNCQEGYIENFYAQFGLASLFEDCECFGNTNEPKAENLRRVIERNRLQQPLMVGDAEGDETAARACGIPFAFVEYGFGSATSPDYRFASFAELTETLLLPGRASETWQETNS